MIEEKKKLSFLKKPKSILLLYLGVPTVLLTVVGVLSFFIPTLKNEKVKVKDDFIDTFSSCEQIAKIFEDTRKSSYETMSSLAEDSLTESPGKGGGGDDYSETNVQVEGVDEADTVKNDGEYIYTVTSGNINIVKAYPSTEAKLVKTIKLVDDSKKNNNYYYGYYSEGGAREIFVDGDKLLAMGTKNVDVKPMVDNLPDWYHPFQTYSFVKVWDISDKSNPKLTRDVEFEGDYTSSRKIGENVHIVLNTYPAYSGIEKTATAEALIPKYSENKGSGRVDYKPSCGCQDVEYFKSIETQEEDYHDNTFVTVLSLSINRDSKDVNRRTIVGNSNTVYASLNNLYLSSLVYKNDGPEDRDGGRYTSATQIHKFALENDSTEYLSSTEMEGTVLNQFSMDESNDYFRIAITKGDIWDTKKKSTNHIYVYNKDLKQVGALDNLAPGEQIYSARFMGDRGYLVTFKNVDPFYVIDLKDPTKPTVLGYLKIPGYSDYLHPYDENHIIGIGKEAVEATGEENAEWMQNFAWYQGIKMAIFDVTDVKNPKEIFKTLIGDRGTESPVLDDHKAFLFSNKKNLLALPISLAELTQEQKNTENKAANLYGEHTFQGAYIYKIDLNNGFVLRGRLTHYSDNNQDFEDNYSWYNDKKTISRILYIEDNVYTVSNEKILINNLDNLAKIGEVILN